MRRSIVGALAILGTLSCSNEPAGVGALPPPSNLFYELQPSGDLDPAGLLLLWDEIVDPNLMVYRVYSRPDAGAAFGLRGETTSSTFHDSGIPDLEYFVAGVDLAGLEGAPSAVLVVDERLRLGAPAWISGTSLNQGIYLAWDDSPFVTEPAGFRQYRVYSAAAYLGTTSYECDGTWGLEGTTLAPEYLVGALPNGIPRCFGVSAESVEGWESLWSPIWGDTPRPDARNELLSALDVDPLASGFRFWIDSNGDGVAVESELGLVLPGSQTNLDFRVTRDASGLWIEAIRSNTYFRDYTGGPIDDLTSIDIAPHLGYARVPLPAQVGHGYVFEMDEGEGFFRYGAIRVTHVGSEVLIFDWSYQTNPANPELSVGAGVFTAGGQGVIVKRP
ncbi:MAG: hypothetical protein JSW43_11020 [Gemmatimonadota bacterium]|nr:MAG: hypothetical protein JSW43_11020 [Gemmatimonadota bacterium]